MSDEKKPTVQTRDMNGWIKGILMVGLAIIVIAVIAKSFGSIGISGFGGYSKTFEVGVRDYSDQQICGLPNGEGMKFKVPDPVYVKLQNDTVRSLSQDILINDTIQGEEFEVEGKCVTMTLSRILEFKSSPNATIKEPQRFRIKFYR